MELSQEKVKHVKEWLDKHWTGDHNCPICKSNVWQIVGMVYEIARFTTEPTTAKTVFPIVNIVCQTCAYTMSFNALVIGVVEQQQKQEPVAVPQPHVAANTDARIEERQKQEPVAGGKP